MERIALEHSEHNERGHSTEALEALKLNVQEAKTGLIAIGPMLAWEPVRSSFASSPDFLWEEARADTDQGYQMYDVTLTANYSPLVGVKVIYWKKNGLLDQEVSNTNRISSSSNSDIHGGGKHWYNSVAEAKAACEVHAATGQFPPGVKPESNAPTLP